MDGKTRGTMNTEPILILLMTIILVITAIYIIPLPASQRGVQLYAEARKSNQVKKDSTVIFLEAVAQETTPITGIVMKASMITPTGEKKTFILEDNGVGKDGDEIKGDGIYATAIAGLEAYGNGTYQFEIEASKKKEFKKHFKLTVKVKELPRLQRTVDTPLCRMVKISPAAFSI